MFHVAVGKSDRELVKLRLLQEFCRDCGHYLHPWSDTVDSALDQAKKGWVSSENKFSSPFIHRSISVHVLYKLIIDGNLEAYEKQIQSTKAEIAHVFRNSPDYLWYHNHLSCNTECPPHRRKNLSLGLKTDASKAAAACVGLLILFCLDAFVSTFLVQF